MKHPHHDIILAYLDGKEVEFKNGSGRWVSVGTMEDLCFPGFYKLYEYRIKPRPKYRVVFKTKSGMLLISAGYYESLSAFEACSAFQSGWVAIELIQATRKEE